MKTLHLAYGFCSLQLGRQWFELNLEAVIVTMQPPYLNACKQGEHLSCYIFIRLKFPP